MASAAIVVSAVLRVMVPVPAIAFAASTVINASCCSDDMVMALLPNVSTFTVLMLAPEISAGAATSAVTAVVVKPERSAVTAPSKAVTATVPVPVAVSVVN